MDKKEFADRLRFCMKHKLYNNKPITAYRLAKLKIVTQSSMENYLNGLYTPDIDVLARLANFFCVSIDWLVTGKNFDERIFFNEESHNMISLFQHQEQLLNKQMEKLQSIENSIKIKTQKSNIAPKESRA